MGNICDTIYIRIYSIDIYNHMNIMKICKPKMKKKKHFWYHYFDGNNLVNVIIHSHNLHPLITIHLFRSCIAIPVHCGMHNSQFTLVRVVICVIAYNFYIKSEYFFLFVCSVWYGENNVLFIYSILVLQKNIQFMTNIRNSTLFLF